MPSSSKKKRSHWARKVRAWMWWRKVLLCVSPIKKSDHLDPEKLVGHGSQPKPEFLRLAFKPKKMPPSNCSTIGGGSSPAMSRPCRCCGWSIQGRTYRAVQCFSTARFVQRQWLRKILRSKNSNRKSSARMGKKFGQFVQATRGRSHRSRGPNITGLCVNGEQERLPGSVDILSDRQPAGKTSQPGLHIGREPGRAFWHVRPDSRQPFAAAGQEPGGTATGGTAFV